MSTDGRDTFRDPRDIGRYSLSEIIKMATSAIFAYGVYEVHISPEGDACSRDWCSLEKFVKDYERGGDLSEAHPFNRYLGVVHQDGAFLVRLPDLHMIF